MVVKSPESRDTIPRGSCFIYKRLPRASSREVVHTSCNRRQMFGCHCELRKAKVTTNHVTVGFLRFSSVYSKKREDFTPISFAEILANLQALSCFRLGSFFPSALATFDFIGGE